MKSILLQILILGVAGLPSLSNAHASNLLAERYVLLGEIASAESPSIAIIYDKSAKKNLFLKLGDAIPGTSLRLTSVQREVIEMSDGFQRHRLVKDKFFVVPGSGTESGSRYAARERLYEYNRESEEAARAHDDDEIMDPYPVRPANAPRAAPYFGDLPQNPDGEYEGPPSGPAKLNARTRQFVAPPPPLYDPANVLTAPNRFLD